MRGKGPILILVLVCAGLLLADLAYHKHGHYHEEELFGFFPAFGLAACVALTLGARALGLLTRRPSEFYGEDDGPGKDRR